MNHIQIEILDNIASIWLNRQEVRNALNAELISEISKAFIDINNNSEVRVVVLRGKGKSFCAGADLNYMKSISEFGYEENYKDSLKLANCFKTIYTCSKPTIALVHGAAIGGANGLLSACDFVFCDNEAKFAFSEVKLGITPATISPYVIKRIGEYRARDLMLTGRLFKGVEAEKIGLANKSLPEKELEDYLTISINLLMTSGPDAMHSCKDLIFDISNNVNFDESLGYTAKMIAKIRASKEGQEGMASFLEKRKPNWIK